MQASNDDLQWLVNNDSDLLTGAIGKAALEIAILDGALAIAEDDTVTFNRDVRVNGRGGEGMINRLTLIP